MNSRNNGTFSQPCNRTIASLEYCLSRTVPGSISKASDRQWVLCRGVQKLFRHGGKGWGCRRLWVRGQGTLMALYTPENEALNDAGHHAIQSHPD